MLLVSAKNAATGKASELTVPALTSTVGDLATKIAGQENCQASQVVLIVGGKVLKDASIPLKGDDDGNFFVVFMVKGKKRPAPAPTTSTPAPTPAPAPAATSASTPSTVAAPSIPIQPAANSESKTSENPGRRVLLLVRHGQCCHEGCGDLRKALTTHGHKQADETARYIKQLFSATNKLPATRGLLHSTSRRASETAAALPKHVAGLDIMSGDLLRETNPTANPFRSENAFQVLFKAPPPGATATTVVVAHNNIILYWLMRAAGMPVEVAQQAWSRFHLRHASITRVDIEGDAPPQVMCVGAAGHIARSSITWNNIQGEDMSAWKGGEPERHKFGGRMLVLVCNVSPSKAGGQHCMQATAEHIKSLTEYMISRSGQVVHTESSQLMASNMARVLKLRSAALPASTAADPELAFQQFCCPPSSKSRDVLVLVAEASVLMYWLLRALQLGPEQAKAVSALYRITESSVSLINVRSSGGMKVVAVGDTGHLLPEHYPDLAAGW